MSEVEYALYERMLPIVEAAPETALNLLETMLADDQPSSHANAGEEIRTKMAMPLLPPNLAWRFVVA